MAESVFFFQAEDGIRDLTVTGVQTCALPICEAPARPHLRNRARGLAGPESHRRSLRRRLRVLWRGAPHGGKWETKTGAQTGSPAPRPLAVPPQPEETSRRACPPYCAGPCGCRL